MTARSYDYRPLARRTGLLARLRAVGSDPLMVIGGTIGFLLLAVPLVVLIALIATGNATDVGGLLFLGFLLLCGAFVAADVLGRTGSQHAIDAFAAANRLIVVPVGQTSDYLATRFSSGAYRIQEAVRTRGKYFLEVGDCTQAPSVGNPPDGKMRLYLRARLTGLVPPETDVVASMPSTVSQRLPALTGGFSIEVRANELTVFGTDGLQPRRPDRVRQAFEVLEELVAGIETACLLPPRPAPAPGANVAQEAGRDHVGATISPWKVLGGTVAVLIVGPLLFAIVMSILDDYLRGRYILAKIVVGLLVVLAVAGIGRLVALVARKRT